MTSPLSRGRAGLVRARERWALVDHAVRTARHYSRVNGSGLAGSVTYFAFLSFFPILALAFFCVGIVARLYPDARDNLVTAVGTMLPHILGGGDGEIRLDTVQSAAGTAGLLGALGLLYSGLGWLTGMRAPSGRAPAWARSASRPSSSAPRCCWPPPADGPPSRSSASRSSC